MKVIIYGADAIGAHLAELFSKIKQNIIIIDEDEARLERVSSECDLLTVHTSSSTPIETFKDVGMKNADLFISVKRDEHLNLNLCVLAKSMGAKRTVARVENAEFTHPLFVDAFQRAGVSSIIYPDDLAAQDIIMGLQMSWVRQRWDVYGGALTMLGIKMREDCDIMRRPLREVCGPGAPYHLLAIKRGAETIIPAGNDMLLPNDYVYFMTTKEFIPEMKKIVGKADYPEVKNVIIVGGGKTAERVVNQLPHGVKVKIFEANTARCEELNEIVDNGHVMVINADGRSVANLLEENVKQAQALVALTGNAEANILTCMTAHELGVRKTVAMIENMDYMGIAGNADIGTIINKQALTASYIYQLLLKGDVTNIRNLLMVNADVAEFTAREGSRVTSKPVCELNLSKHIELGGLVRNGVGMLVNGSTRIQPGDNVVVFCKDTNISQIEKIFI
ncbi:MAG: Trk system potassium transporter TrkA [Muribaculaceae bacterium]|jgi:trk system potassium uptake protein TrkA|nr:Trk system potassium transporter TrkA [Muribaculaceae bacterium]